MHTAFAGIVYPDPLQVSDLIENMLAPLRHRGTNPKEVRTFKNFQIGALGSPLLTNSKKTLFLAFDGWLENEKALRGELTSFGYRIEPDQDIVLFAYEHWGIKFLERFKGEFALALLDQEKQDLILARDPIGKKPLYWYPFSWYQ